MSSLPTDVRSRFRDSAATLGAALNEDGLCALERYVAELQLWAPRQNLVAEASTETLLNRHLLDSLAATEPIRSRLRGPIRLLDLGSGAGLPGLPLGIGIDAGEIVLVEPRQRRAHFLRAVARQLPAHPLRVVCARANELPAAHPDLLGNLDVVVSRATFSDPAEFLKHASLLLRPGGLAVRWCRLAPPSTDAVPGLGFARIETHTYELPVRETHRALEIHTKAEGAS